MSGKLIAVVAAVVALLAPASIAQAAEPLQLRVGADLAAVYPVIDGYQDKVHISGEVDGVSQRIRGAVVVAVGGRAVKTVILSTTGAFGFDWNGRAAKNAIVSGPATVTLRVDGYAPVSATVKVSAKKLYTVTRTTTQILGTNYLCWDAGVGLGSTTYDDIDRMCPNSYGSPVPDFIYLTLRGTRTDAGLVYLADVKDPAYWASSSVLPAKVTVTATFRQTGSGVSRMWVVPWADHGDDYSAGPNPVATFGPGTKKVTVTGRAEIDLVHRWSPEFMVTVPPTADVRASTFRITVTYYKLK